MLREAREYKKPLLWFNLNKIFSSDYFTKDRKDRLPCYNKFLVFGRLCFLCTFPILNLFVKLSKLSDSLMIKNALIKFQNWEYQAWEIYFLRPNVRFFAVSVFPRGPLKVDSLNLPTPRNVLFSHETSFVQISDVKNKFTRI